jgi:hypothetical protein
MGLPFSAAFPVDGVVIPIFSVFSPASGPQALTNGSVATTNAKQRTPATISNLLLFIDILLKNFNHPSIS